MTLHTTIFPDRAADGALKDLEQRVRELENAGYFEAVNNDEQRIFRVGPGGVRDFNKIATAVAAIGTSQAGALAAELR